MKLIHVKAILLCHFISRVKLHLLFARSLSFSFNISGEITTRYYSGIAWARYPVDRQQDMLAGEN